MGRCEERKWEPIYTIALKGQVRNILARMTLHLSTCMPVDSGLKVLLDIIM